MAVSSINFQKSSEHSYDHNFRYDSPNYLLKEEDRLENSYWENEFSAKEIFNDELSKAHRRGGRIPKFENSHWEAVLNLNKEHTLDDVKKVADYLENKLNITCATIAVHRDEGHYKDGKACYNFHAHLTFVTYKNGQQSWRNEKIRPILSEVQTEVAKILNMDRGQENSEKTRLSVKQFKKVAQELEAKNQEIQELKTKNQELEAELEQEKLSKNQLEKLIKEERKAMIQKNKELEEANQQKIYNADDYKKLRELKEKQDITIAELNAEIKKIKQEAQERESKIKEIFYDEIDKMEAEIKEKDNIIESQNAKIANLLTQDQIQEIINQVLAQKEAEIEKKNQEISKLQAEKEQFQKLLETNQALREAYYHALETLEKISKQDQEQKNEVIQTQNQEKTTNNEIKYYSQLFDLIQDDVSTFQTTNTDKTEVPKQNQTQNQKNYLPLSDLIQDDVSLNQKEEQEKKPKNLRQNK